MPVIIILLMPMGNILMLMVITLIKMDSIRTQMANILMTMANIQMPTAIILVKMDSIQMRMVITLQTTHHMVLNFFYITAFYK